MIQIAIDGACKGNGQANCTSASGAVINNNGVWQTLGDTECNSTNQRGEMYALLSALVYCAAQPADEDIQIITDSEYLFNTMTKEWYKGWINRGWKTSLGEPVKNQALWQVIVETYNRCAAVPMFYHIKGHLVPDGGIAAMDMLEKEGPCSLYKFYYGRVELQRSKFPEKFERAQELSVQNNGFMLQDDILKSFVALNGVADRVAVNALIQLS